MAYADGNDLLARYDARILGDLIQDTGTRTTNTVTIAADANVAASLADASGLIESACFVGNRYSAADLSGLAGNGLALIKRITCDLAFALLRQRRGYDLEQFPLVEKTYALLDRLRLGERVFDVDEVEDKGNPTTDAIRIDTILQLNLIRDNIRYFPVRRWNVNQ